MTAKEAFERLVKKISISTDEDTWNLLTEDTKYPLKQLEEYEVVLKSLNELEFYKSFPQIQEASLIPEVNIKLVTCELNLRELKRDVARYFNDTQLEGKEYDELYDKLSKVTP